MVEEMIRNMSKKTWYRWSLYIYIILFFIVGIFIYFLVKDSIAVGRSSENAGDIWLYVARDIAFIAIALALIFFQSIRNLFTIMRRSL
jgi:hypothetical protein